MLNINNYIWNFNSKNNIASGRYPVACCGEYSLDKANATLRKCDANQDLFEKFSLQNIDNYRSINENYNKIYEKEKSLRLIKCDKQK